MSEEKTFSFDSKVFTTIAFKIFKLSPLILSAHIG